MAHKTLSLADLSVRKFAFWKSMLKNKATSKGKSLIFSIQSANHHRPMVKCYPSNNTYSITFKNGLIELNLLCSLRFRVYPFKFQ